MTLVIVLIATHLIVALAAYQRGSHDQHQADNDLRAALAAHDELTARRIQNAKATHPAFSNVVPFPTPDQAS